MLFNESKVPEKGLSQLPGIFDHAASRLPFMIRGAKRKLRLPKLQGLFHVTIRDCSYISSVDR